MLGVGVFSVVNTLFSKNILHFGQQPRSHLCVRRFFPQLLLHGIGILYQLACNVLGCHILICVFQPGTQHGCDQPGGFSLCLFLAPSQLFHGPGRFCLPYLIQHRVGSVMVPIHNVRLHDVPQHALPANGLHDFFITVLLAFGKPHLRLCYHLHRFPFICQICRLNGVFRGKAFCQLLRALAGGFHVQRTRQHIAPGKGAFGGLAAQLGQFGVQLHGLICIYLVLHVRPGRRPGIRAIHPVCTVGLRVNGIRAKHQRDGTILTVAVLCLHHRDRRRRHPAQFQSFFQVLFGQVMHGYQFLCTLHLDRCAQLEPHRFLHSLVGSLAFAGGLCYTIFRKWLRGFTALLGFEYRGKAAFFFCYRPVFNGEQTSV